MSRHDVVTSLDKVDPELGIFIDLDPDAVLREARATREGRLAGIPIAVKDLIDTAGSRTTYGSSMFSDHFPERDADIVADLRAEGAIIFGKTNLDEFAFGVSGYNSAYGPVLNPHDTLRTAGGSSSGSAAAVAAGICRLALGTDTSGSVRIPAACCGVYGLKLSRDRIAMRGIYPLARQYDSIGFFAAGVEDLMQLLAFKELPDVSSLRIGHLGVDLEVPPMPESAHWTLFREQAWQVHGDRFSHDPAGYGRSLQRQLQRAIGNVDTAHAELESWRARYREAVAGYDVLVGPILDGKAPLVREVQYDYDHDESNVRDRLLRHTPIYNQLGWTALAVPTEDGPIQVAAPPGGEAKVLAVGADLGLTAAQTMER